MRYELRLHRLLLSLMAVAITFFILVLFWMNLYVDETFEAILSLIIVIVVATLFAYIGAAEGILAFYFGSRHRRELIAYLALGLLSISSALYLAISQDESLQVVSLIASPHAFLFGLAELRIAKHLERHQSQRRALIVCGFCELALGFGLICGLMLPSKTVAEILGGTALMTLLQLLLMLFYRDSPAERRLDTR